ncbi:hypothetical protein M422DRAFT_774738 [Sphaerobolus stellatus SS14]|nr:hypothetical protein M422DRAFT_774738 [Sphaerobolus stellatus SS14]
MSIPITLLPQAASVLQGQDPQGYNTIAALGLLAWDIAITIDEEILLIWGSKCTLSTFLYFGIRYGALVIQTLNGVFYVNVSGVFIPSVVSCAFWVWFNALLGYVVHVCVDILFVMRVYAFYGRDNRLLGILCFLLAGAAIPALILGIFTLLENQTTPNPFPPRIQLPSCLLLTNTSIFASRIWIAELIFQSLLVILITWRFIAEWRVKMALPELFIIFTRDGVWAFFVIFGTMCFFTIGFQISLSSGATAAIWIFTIFAICGNRLILNLRSAAVQRAMTHPRSMDIEIQALSQLSA